MVHNLWMLLCISEVIRDAVLIVSVVPFSVLVDNDGKEKLFLIIMRKRKRGNGEKEEKKSGEIVKESHCSRGNGLFICLRDTQIVSLYPSTYQGPLSPAAMLNLCMQLHHRV